MTQGPISRTIAKTFSPPVMEARRWLEGVEFPPERPLLNLSQAAPVDPPTAALRDAMVSAVAEDDSHIYGPVLGLPALRSEIAAENVAITSGCNLAFCAVMSTIASAGDAVILPTPWYFNHKMWLDTAGVETRLLPCGEGMLPDPEAARGLIDEKVKAIILVTPNNPTGAEYPKGLLDAFMALAKEHGLALIVGETYRDFHSQSGAYFAYVEHPFDIPSDEIAKLLVQQQSLLILADPAGHDVSTNGHGWEGRKTTADCLCQCR